MISTQDLFPAQSKNVFDNQNRRGIAKKRASNGWTPSSLVDTNATVHEAESHSE